MGAKANVYACIYLKTPLSEQFVFSFTTNGDQCMNSSGSAATLTVEAGVQGFQYISIGTVESKKSGVPCDTEPSLWTLGYNTTPNTYSQSVQSNWHYKPHEHNSIELNNPGSLITVNTEPNYSTMTSQEWQDTGDLYIIFAPF